MRLRRLTVVVALLLSIAALLFILRRRSSRGGTAGEDAATSGRAGDPPSAEAINDERAPRGAIGGRVTDPGGHGIAGASVCARASSTKLVSVHTRVPSCATADAAGHYRI